MTKKCSGGTVTRSATDCTGTTALTLSWDTQDRLTQVTGSVPASNAYTYDPLDYRIGKTDSKGALSHYLEGEHLEASYSGTTLKAKYLRGAVIDELVNGYAYDAAGKWTNLTYHHDRLTSVVGISGHNGDALQTLSYGAFGNVLANNLNGTFPANTQKYTGREEDPDTGFYYYRARYYDREAGRFLSEDPLGFEAGINFYAYVDNNPVNANDPTGNVVMQAAGGAVGAASGFAFQVGSDLANWRLGSPAEYAGAVVGGAAGGIAATTCGPWCAGGAAAAASNLTTQAINGQGFSGGSFVTDTAFGAVGGQVVGRYLPAALTSLKGRVPESLKSLGPTWEKVKGNVGEALTDLGLQLTGQSIVRKNVANDFGDSTFDRLTAAGRYVESKFGTADWSSPAQRAAAKYYGPNGLGILDTYRWSYPILSGIAASGPAAGLNPSASGGFVLYPSKANTNMVQAVYAK